MIIYIENNCIFAAGLRGKNLTRRIFLKKKICIFDFISYLCDFQYFILDKTAKY